MAERLYGEEWRFDSYIITRFPYPILSNPDVSDLTKQALKEKGFDGLFNSHMGCGCSLDDLMPCGEPSPHCEAGVLVKAEDLPEDFEPLCEECDWYIFRENPIE